MPRLSRQTGQFSSSSTISSACFARFALRSPVTAADAFLCDESDEAYSGPPPDLLKGEWNCESVEGGDRSSLATWEDKGRP